MLVTGDLCSRLQVKIGVKAWCDHIGSGRATWLGTFSSRPHDCMNRPNEWSTFLAPSCVKNSRKS